MPLPGYTVPPSDDNNEFLNWLQKAIDTDIIKQLKIYHPELFEDSIERLQHKWFPFQPEDLALLVENKISPETRLIMVMLERVYTEVMKNQQEIEALRRKLYGS